MVEPQFVSHCRELLAPLGPVRVRRMFGGWGLYVDDLFIAFDRLYLKADADTRAHFETAGCAPFVYTGQGKPVTMNYWTAPDEAMDAPAAMAPWARLAVQAALAARAQARPPRGKAGAAARAMPAKFKP
jgi:DNA transformation protein